MIPQEKSAAVTRGLREAFGVTEFEDIRVVTGGHTSSLVFRIVVGGTPFLLKIILRTDDPSRHYTSMKAAAEAGLAPRVLYTSAEDRISITDFVQAVPLPITEALLRLPRLLRSLHALPKFSSVSNEFNTSCMFLLNQGPAVEGFLKMFAAANIFPKDSTEQLFAWCAQVAAVYPRHDADMVSSHNDVFKPDNILFDGQRVWLVDWEAAFLNDRYADLAAVANLVVRNPADENLYLEEYFGKPPDAYQRARFFLMQQVAHMFYTMVFLWMGAAGQPVELSDEAPDFQDFHRRMWAGEVDLADKPTKVLYGRAHWEQLQRNMEDRRFQEALRMVSERGASA